MEDWRVGRAHLPGDGDNWFTDGSKNREGAGAGVYGKNSDTRLMVPLGPHSTVLQTEIAAILQCAHAAQNHGRNRNIRICSDSRAAITTLDKSVTTSTLAWECYEALNKLADDNRVTVLWIPGHRGIKGNETADRLAKLATKKQNPSGLEPVIGISNRSVTVDINKWLTEKHQEEWYKATACKQAKALMGEYLNPKRAADLRRLSRTEVKTITEVLIGHGNLASHRHKIGLAKSPLCRLCGEDNETSPQILCRGKRAVSPKYTVADLVSTRTYSKVVRMRLLIMGSIQMSLHEVSQGFEPFDSVGPGVDIPGTRGF